MKLSPQHKLAISWLLGASGVAGVAMSALIVALLTGAAASGWDGIHTSWLFGIVAVALALTVPWSLLAGRGHAEPTLTMGGTLLGIALFSPLTLELNSGALLLLLPALGSVLGLLPAVTTRGPVRGLLAAWALTAAGGVLFAVLLLSLDATA